MKLNHPFQIRRKFLVAVAALIFALIMLPAALLLFNSNRITAGASLEDLDLSAKKIDEARRVLEEKFSQFGEQKINFVWQDKSWQISPWELGINLDLEQSANEIYAFGHRRNIFASLVEQTTALFFGKNLALRFSVDLEKFRRAVASLSSIETPPQNAALKYNREKEIFEVAPEKTGLVINRYQLVNEIVGKFNQTPSTISLALKESAPLVTQKDVYPHLDKAKDIIALAPYTIRAAGLDWALEKAELADWLCVLLSPENHGMVIGLDKNETADFLAQIAPSINREPINAKIVWKNNEIKFTEAARNGQKLNLEASFAQIQASVLTKQKDINLVINVVKPVISDNETLKSFGIETLLGQGESNFSGSSLNRQKNLALGALKLNGILIKTDEEFSFGQKVGEIDEANGWVPELIIKDNKIVPELGGGLCQVSTTLFRAAAIAGLKITERHPHAIPVRYYNPQGFDATVYPPSVDLKFINDTPNNILLQSRIENNLLIFEIYGTADGRIAKIIGPKIIESNPNGSMKTILTQEIWRDEALEHSDIFRSNYKSPAAYPLATNTTQ